MNKLISIAAALVLASGCTTMSPVSATSNNLGAKKGVSCETAIMLIPLGGRPTIYDAALAGEITKISTVDTHATGIFPFYYDRCVVVHGS